MDAGLVFRADRTPFEGYWYCWHQYHGKAKGSLSSISSYEIATANDLSLMLNETALLAVVAQGPVLDLYIDMKHIGVPTFLSPYAPT